MSKAEKFIEDCTKNYSNEYLIDSKPDGLGGYISRRKFSPWLTPDQAKKAVEIAKEEIVEKVINWIENNFYLYEGISGYYVAKELKRAMKDE